MKEMKKMVPTRTKKVSDDDISGLWKRNRKGDFTIEERKLILRLVNLHRDVLLKKMTTFGIVKQKTQAWKNIHKMYLEHGDIIRAPRSLKQLQRCYQNMKCNARRGNLVAINLVKWAKEQYDLEEKKRCQSEERKKRSANSLAVDEDCDVEPRPDREPKDKLEEVQNPSEQSLDENVKFREAVNNSECTHCPCEKNEKNAKVELMVLQKRLNEELHQLEMNLVEEKLKNQKELHKLRVHEMSLKIENQRRRAEILDKELENIE